MPPEPQLFSPRTTAACVLAGMLLLVLPDSVTMLIRDAVRGAFAPTQEVVSRSMREMRESWRAMISAELADERRLASQLHNRLKLEELKRHRNQIAVARLQKELDYVRAHGVSPFTSDGSQPLLVSQSVEARIIGQEIVAAWKSHQLLDAGSRDRILEDQWVLERSTVALDQGQLTQIESGLPALAGRCLVGRIAQVGRWTSSLQLITDPAFRSKAMLATGMGEKTRFSAAFLIEGTGNGQCRLAEVPASVRVAKGDAVYTVPGERAIDAPMLLGHVVSIDRTDGALHHDIVVRPAAELHSLSRVQIVTTVLNPARLVSQR